MSAILAECISKLQLEDVPGLTPKAAQFFDQIGQRLSRSKNSALALCRQAVAVQLACESMSVEFNEAAACSLSSVSTSDFRSCVKDVRTSLGLVKHITLEELDVQHGPPQGIIESARRLLDEFKLRLSATMPAAVSRSTNWEDSVYIAGAFFLVCRQLKKRVVAKPTLVAAAGVKPAIFNSAVAKLEQFGSETLKAITAGGIGALKTPSRKRVRETHEGDAENTPKSAARSRAKSRTPAAQTTSTQISDELGDIDSVARKRVRRTASVRQPATEPIKRTNPTRRQAPQLGTPPTFATATAPDGPGDTPVPVQRKRGRPPMSAAQIAAKSEAAAKTAAAAVRRKKAEAASRLRFGIIGMVQDRDYRDTAQYASYQDWKASILKAK